MENPSEAFIFSAQRTPDCSMDLESDKNGDASYTAKRARPEQDLLGRNDVDIPNGSGSFKSKLMGMSAPRSWSGFGTNKEKLRIDADDISISEGPTGPMMKLSPKLKEQLHKPWANALILKNMGRFHILNFMLSKLSQKWTLIGHWQLTDLGEGYFVARFQMREDLEYVLTNGPWVISNQYLVVQRWKPNFVPGEDSIQTMPIWVRLSKLPMEWMDPVLLWSIGGMLGRMCKVDPITEIQARGRFARICVEIDISKPLLGTLGIEDRAIKVEYESLGLVCFKCGRYGHSKDKCREGVVEPIVEEVEPTMTDKAEVKKDDPLYGPWLLVSYGRHGYRDFKGRNGRMGNGNVSIPNRSGAGSRFGGNSHDKKKEREMSDAKIGKNAEKVSHVKSVRGSGSRFDILNEDSDMMVAEGEVPPKTKHGEGETSHKSKAVLTEITNQRSGQGEGLNRIPVKNNKKTNKNVISTPLNRMNSKTGGSGSVKEISYGKKQSQNYSNPVNEECDSGDVLRQFHKEAAEFEVQSTDKNNSSSVSQTKTSFEVVASELEGALAAISEE